MTYIASKCIYREHHSRVVMVGLSNFSFSFCLSLFVCKMIRLWLKVEQDNGLSLAVSFLLALMAQWVILEAGPEVRKKLISAWRGFSLRETLLNFLDPKRKK